MSVRTLWGQDKPGQLLAQRCLERWTKPPGSLQPLIPPTLGETLLPHLEVASNPMELNTQHLGSTSRSPAVITHCGTGRKEQPAHPSWTRKDGDTGDATAAAQPSWAGQDSWGAGVTNTAGKGKEESKNTQLALPSSRDKNQQRCKNLSFPPILAKSLLQTATI